MKFRLTSVQALSLKPTDRRRVFCEEFFSLSLFGVIRTQIQKEKSATSSKNNIERAKTIVFGVKNMNNTLKTSTNNSKIAPKARFFLEVSSVRGCLL